MKVKFYYLKFLTCTLLVLPVISMLSLQAQDYYISFAGTGESTTVDSVIVENLTQGTKLKMKGNDVLHLVGVVTGIEAVRDNETGKINFYPNPMKDYSKMQFDLPEKGEAVITLYNLSGGKIVQTRDLLSEGRHTYDIQGIEEGLYIVRINEDRYSFSGKLICTGSQNGGAKIVYENTLAKPEEQIDSKGINAEKEMQYTIGDRLKFTGISGNYYTVVTDIPAAGKQTIFEFNDCTDREVNNYSIVRIGSQLWMGENLKTTLFANGENIPYITDNTSWASQGVKGSPAYCWYNNEVRNKNIYGALYNCYTIEHFGLCPDGWHIPALAEWIRLTDYLGGWSGDAGAKLKETGTTYWLSPNTGTTNETGFTARPGGYRYSNGIFFNLGLSGSWWYYYPNTEPTSHYIMLVHSSSSISIGSSNKSAGMSVRCLKDYHLKDIDGNPYTTVKIGNQVWMVENLKTTHYNDGNAITLVTDSAKWSLLSTPGYCWYINDTANKTYGALYNWYTVSTGKLCPEGWHVSTTADWFILIDYLGGAASAGGKLKESGTTNWISPNIGATNESGFTGLPGGFRYNTGAFESFLGDYVHYWSAFENYERTDVVLLGSNTSTAMRDYSVSNNYGCSVRCVKDE